MSIFFPYTPDIVIDYFSVKFAIDLTTLSSYETLSITLLANIYFFFYWTIIIYFSLKLFNRLWERFL